MSSSMLRVDCDYEGLKCVDADSQIVTGICTDRYVQCTEGIQTCPIYTPSMWFVTA